MFPAILLEFNIKLPNNIQFSFKQKPSAGLDKIQTTDMSYEDTLAHESFFMFKAVIYVFK